MAAKTLGNKYTLTINHFDFQQIKTASASSTTIRLIRHDVINWVIELFFRESHCDNFRLSTKS
jgi:hypothetical protein